MEKRKIEDNKRDQECAYTYDCNFKKNHQDKS